MAIGKDGAVRRQLRTLFNVGTVRDLTDGQLLERFATDSGRGRRAGLRRPGRAPWPDGHAGLPGRAGRFARRAGRVSGHIPGAGQAGARTVGAGFDRSLAAPGGLPDRDVRADDRGPPPPPRAKRGDRRAGDPARAGLRARAAAARRDRPPARSAIARPWSSATWKAAPTNRRRDTSAGQWARSRADSSAAANASAMGCSAAARPRMWASSSRGWDQKPRSFPSPLPCWIPRLPPRCDLPRSVRPSGERPLHLPRESYEPCR